jgi:8-oxo-dGTP diphosphatase
MRDWVVGGALIVSDEGVLLVQNRRRNGSHDWTPPGGVIDEGETLLDGLTREVEEETGLRVTAWAGPVYEVHCEAPDMGWRLRVEAHVAVAYEGELHVDDPDGIVVDARFVALEVCEGLVGGGHPWVREPLGEWLRERWPHHISRPYGFHVTGRAPDDVVVIRAEP